MGSGPIPTMGNEGPTLAMCGVIMRAHAGLVKG
jgi:hypothetical protein